MGIHKLLALFFLTICVAKGNTQDFILVDTIAEISTVSDDSRRIIDINTCMLTTNPTDVGNPAGIPTHPIDMTITGRTSAPGVPVSLILDSDPDNNVSDINVTYNFVWVIGSPTPGVPFAPETAPQGISTDYNFYSYLIGNHISYVNELTDEVTSLGTFLPNQRPKAHMTFREGSFYYPSVNNELMQLKISGSNYWIRALGSLPDTINYGGIFSIPHSCDSTSTYVIHHDPSRGSTMYLLDIPSVTLTQHCTMPYKPSAAAFEGENTLPPCNFSFDLDTAIDTTINRYDTICSGTIALLDENIELLTNLEYDSLIIEIINPLDAPNEWIEVNTTHPEVTISNNQSSKIRLQSTGFAKGNYFMDILQSLSYTQNAVIPTTGIREVKIQVFHPFYDGLEASVFINIPDDVFDINEEAIDPSCFGLSDGSITLTINGGAAPIVFEWEDDNSLGFSRNNLTEGDYIWQVSDALGCALKDTVFLLQPDTLVVSLSSQQDTICGDSGTLISMPQGGTMPYVYAWSDGSSDSLATNLVAGDHNLNITDENDCLATATYTLFSADTLFQSEIIESCLGQPISVNGQSYEQNTTFQELLTTLDGCDSLVDYQLIFYDTFYSSTNYILCAGEDIDINGMSYNTDTTLIFAFSTTFGCDSTEYHNIDVLPTSSQLLIQDICEGEVFDFNNDFIGESGLYADTLTAFNGCDSIIQLQLTVHSLPEPIIQESGSLCAGENVFLSATGYSQYLWSTGDDAPEISIANAGEYSVLVEDEYGCEGEAMISITDSALLVTYHIEQPLCPEDGGRIIFDDFSGGQSPYFVIETGAIVEVTSVINDLNTGLHTFTIEDSEGCENVVEANIFLGTSLEVVLPELLPMNLGESIVLNPIPSFSPSTILWSPDMDLSCNDCLKPTASPRETTAYTLTLESGDGCLWEGSILLTVKTNGLYIPNAFSPNDDGRNDEFTVFPSTSVESINSIQIFDRWGALVFESNANTMQWDGNIAGQKAAQAVYLYQIEWTDLNGRVVVDSGDLILLR